MDARAFRRAGAVYKMRKAAMVEAERDKIFPGRKKKRIERKLKRNKIEPF